MKKEAIHDFDDIIIIADIEKDKSGISRVIVSHGVNVETLENIILPQIQLDQFISNGWCKWSRAYNGWMLK